MRWGLFVLGVLIGLVGGVGGIIYLQERNKGPDTAGEMAIVFAAKNYYETDAMVMISGTLTGDGLAYPNNTYSMACFQDRKECWMTSVEAIGDKQIGRMDAPYEYEIRKWTPYEIVAAYDGSFGCYKITITIQRKSQDVLWVEEPINQAQPQCVKSETKIRKFTIEDSPGWKRVFRK
jgi:hypothetical protein